VEHQFGERGRKIVKRMVERCIKRESGKREREMVEWLVERRGKDFEVLEGWGEVVEGMVEISQPGKF